MLIMFLPNNENPAVVSNPAIIGPVGSIFKYSNNKVKVNITRAEFKKEGPKPAKAM
ncbi:hypothetical protein UT300016_34150 [Clostridium senegalense]